MDFRKFFIFAAAMAASAPLFAADADFDRGFDFNALKESVTEKLPPTPMPTGYSTYRYTTDCHTFRLSPSHFAIKTDFVQLRSQEFVNECHYVHVPDNPPPPSNHGNNTGPKPNNGHNTGPKPNNGNNHPPKPPKPGHKSADTVTVDEDAATRGQKLECRERPGQVFRHNVALNIEPRDLYPWENEAITVCAEHDRSYISRLDSPFKYNVYEKSDYSPFHKDKTFELTPRQHLPSAPDENGLAVKEFSYDSGMFTFALAENWESYYRNERVRIIVELYRDRAFIDKNIGKKSFDFDTNFEYVIRFSKEDFEKDKKSVDEDEANTRKKTEYYVKWGFQRLGTVSTNQYIKKGKTHKLTMD